MTCLECMRDVQFLTASLGMCRDCTRDALEIASTSAPCKWCGKPANSPCGDTDPYLLCDACLASNAPNLEGSTHD